MARLIVLLLLLLPLFSGCLNEDSAADLERASAAMDDSASESEDVIESVPETVKSPRLEFERPVATDKDLAIGESAEIAWNVENKGTGEHDAFLQVKVNDEVVEKLPLKLAPGEQATLSYEFTAKSAGTFKIQLVGAPPIAIVVRDPADLSVVTFEVEPHELMLGETFTVTFDVANAGGTTGEFTVPVVVNSKEVRSESFTLDAGEQVAREVKLVAEKRGVTLVQVGEFEEKLTVLKPATFEYANLTGPSGPVATGSRVTFTVDVHNTGDVTGELKPDLVIDGVSRTHSAVSVRAGESKTLELVWPEAAHGTHDVTVGDLPQQSVTVKHPARFELSSFDAEPRQVLPGESVNMRVVVRNVGELEGSYTVIFTEGGQTLNSKTVTLAGGAEQTVTHTWIKNSAGSYTIGVTNGGSATITVLRPAEAEFAATSLSTSSVSAGDTVTVTTTVRNVGDVTGTFQVPFRVGGQQVDAKSVTVQPGDAVTVSFSYHATTEGDQALQIGSGNAATLRVKVPSLSLDTSWSNGWCSEYLYLDVTVANNGDGIARNIAVSAHDTDGEDSASRRISELAPGQSTTLRLTLTLPESCGDSDIYTIVVEATPQYGNSESVSFNVDL